MKISRELFAYVGALGVSLVFVWVPLTILDVMVGMPVLVYFLLMGVLSFMTSVLFTLHRDSIYDALVKAQMKWTE